MGLYNLKTFLIRPDDTSMKVTELKRKEDKKNTTMMEIKRTASCTVCTQTEEPKT